MNYIYPRYLGFRHQRINPMIAQVPVKQLCGVSVRRRMTNRNIATKGTRRVHTSLETFISKSRDYVYGIWQLQSNLFKRLFQFKSFEMENNKHKFE